MTSASFQPVRLALPALTPSLAIEVLPHGVTVHRIIVQADGRTHDILIGPEYPNDFLSPYHKYHNTIVGRYTNRIPVGTHEIERRGFKAQVSPQGNQADPKVSLHGGPKGFDDVDWDVIHPMNAELFSQKEKLTIGSQASVVFSHTSPDGDQGFPGTLKTEVMVALIPPSVADIEANRDGREELLGSALFVYRAKLLEEGKVTPVNLTQHWGFNLEASLKDDASNLSVKSHKLTMKSAHHVALDSSFLSTNALTPVQGTARQHASKVIGQDFPESGYDEFYVFEKDAPVAAPSRITANDLESIDLLEDIILPAQGKKEPVVELSSDKSGLKLAFSTNQSGVQFYSGGFIVPQSARKRIHGGSGEVEKGDGYLAGAGAFLEFHEPLAAFLNPATSLIGNDTLLASGELYNNFTKMDVYYKRQT